MKRLNIHFLLITAFVFLSFPSAAQDIQDLIHKCATSAGDDVTYLKDFVVKLGRAEDDKKPPLFRQSLALRKNITYRFSICSMENSEGEAVLWLYDEATLILSSYYPESGKEYNAINFLCKKSGIYTVIISFKEGKPGEAIGILSYVNKQGNK